MGLVQIHIKQILNKDPVSNLIWFDSGWTAHDKLGWDMGLDVWPQDPLEAAFVMQSK